jgi:hypothetical protein
MRTRQEQIEAIRADQRFWRGLAAEVGRHRYSEPGPMGEWNFGDLAGHLLGWRNRTIRRLEAFAADKPQPANPWPADLDEDTAIDEVNAWIRAQDAGRSPEQLVADYDRSYDRLIRALESMSDDKMTDPMAIDWLGGPLVDVDFTGHLHEEHVPDVRAWFDQVR